jgi:hypothetical protein
MMSPEEKAEHAYEEDTLPDLFMGKWPYYEPEAYMAPSNVPTNWQKILEGLSSVSERLPGVSTKVNLALQEMTRSPEGVYCALETILSYLDSQTFLSPALHLDYAAIADAARRQLPTVKADACQLHLPWMGPTAETLWTRIQHVSKLLQEAHGIQVL